MKITYLYQPGRLARLPGIRKGELPTEFFYGAPELESKGHTVRYIEVHDVPAERRLRIVVELLVRKRFLPAKVYFALLAGVQKLLPDLHDTDVIVATTPGIAFSLAILNSLPFYGTKLQAKIVAIHCGILNYPHNSIRLFETRWLLRRMWTLLYGVGELDSMVTNFRIPADRIQVNCFGVDERFWSPEIQKDDKGYILSIGNDSNRDYQVLLRAAESIRRPVKLVTRRQLPKNLPNNVELLYGSWHTQALDDQGLRDLYRKAFCVVVPLKDSLQPSGQSVTLQAMACGTPVILTRTSGLWEKAGLQNNENVLFVEPDKKEEIVKAVELLVQDEQLYSKMCREGRDYVLQYGCISNFANRIETLCEQAIASIGT